METLAYLYIAQENEAPEPRECSFDHQKLSSQAAVLGIACSIGAFGVAGEASAQPCYLPFYPSYTPIYSPYQDYYPVYSYDSDYYPVYSQDYSYSQDYYYYYPDYSYSPDPSSDSGYYPVSPITYYPITSDDLASLGAYGELVSATQTKLANLGYYTGAIDGTYGPATYDAVIAYQSDYGLLVDGVIGPETVSSLGLYAGV